MYVRGERVVVLGPDIEVICGLIRRGCRDVTALQQNDRPERGSADIVIVPAIRSADAAACTIAHARRALAPSGRVLLRTAASPAGWLGVALERTLRLHDFSAIRVRRVMDRAVFMAELPLFASMIRS
jgi:hypothetical protein